MQERIEQFKKMAEADPQNEMGHFSLGKAYFDDGQFDNAIASLTRTLELNPTYSKAYQLLGDAQAKAGNKDAALATLTKGFEVADERGDRMPRDAMAKTISELGGTPPASKHGGTAQATLAEGTDFNCSRCGRPSAKMAERPFKGALGELVWANVCQVCWREWIGVGTKVINEMGLQLADPRAQQIYDDHLKEFLQLPE
ncbi:MAG: Fe(2+)-trafficking protein [Phycisphaerales bacterium]|nr:Fe(2+)-trafficking protein [Phycisphaerales bacterium]